MFLGQCHIHLGDLLIQQTCSTRFVREWCSPPPPRRITTQVLSFGDKVLVVVIVIVCRSQHVVSSSLLSVINVQKNVLDLETGHYGV